jgi:excisionase family DNA binding protein
MSSRASDHYVSTHTPTSANTANNAHRIRRNRGPERPLHLTLDDGSVIIPPAVASDVLRALVRDLTARVRADGGEVAPDVRRLLYALHAAAHRADIERSSDNGTAPSPPATVTEVSVDEAAALLECTPEYVRRLARRGTLAARRIGRRAWAINRTALEHHRHGTGATAA